MRLTWVLPAGLVLFAFVPVVLATRAAAEEARRLTDVTRSWVELRRAADALRADVAGLSGDARDVLARHRGAAG